MTHVVGVGNDLRGDDVAGLLTARHLRELRPPGISIEEWSGDVARLIEIIAEEEDVILVDACRWGRVGQATSISTAEIDTLSGMSSHGVGIGEALGIARALGPVARLRVWGIAGRSFALGDPVSAAVSRASRRLAVLIAAGRAAPDQAARPCRGGRSAGGGIG